MRVATWNVNGLRARLDFVLRWLRDRRPDIVGFQEIKVTEEGFPFDQLEAEGYRALVHGQKGWNGVAVLARDKAVLVRKGLPGHEEEGARLITARVGDLSFTTIYVPNGKHTAHEDFPRKLAWLDDLATHLREHSNPGEAQVLCGDFNICPAPADSWNEEMLGGSIFHTDDERARFRKLLGTGLHDLYRETNPSEPGFTWWDYRGGAFHRGQGLRIDFLLATECVRARLESVMIDRDYRKKLDGMIPSDHVPVVVDLR